MCVCVCFCVFAFFSAIWNPIGIPFGTNVLCDLEKVLKQQNFKKSYFSQRYCPFSIFIKDFSVNLTSDYRKTKAGRNLILFANKLIGQRQKFTGNIFAQKGQVFYYACLTIRLSPWLILATRSLKLINNLSYLKVLKDFLSFTKKIFYSVIAIFPLLLKNSL